MHFLLCASVHTRCRQRPPQHSKCEPSRRPQQPCVQPWPSCSAPTTYARHRITSRSHTSTCTFVTTSTLKTKVASEDLHGLYLSSLYVFLSLFNWLCHQPVSAYDSSLRAATNKRITGGAMQLSFSSITLDYYPFHRAGTNPAVLLILLLWNVCNILTATKCFLDPHYELTALF